MGMVRFRAMVPHRHGSCADGWDADESERLNRSGKPLGEKPEAVNLVMEITKWRRE